MGDNNRWCCWVLVHVADENIWVCDLKSIYCAPNGMTRRKIINQTFKQYLNTRSTSIFAPLVVYDDLLKRAKLYYVAYHRVRSHKKRTHNSLKNHFEVPRTWPNQPFQHFESAEDAQYKNWQLTISPKLHKCKYA